MRMGLGMDVHPFAAGGTLVLGGVEVPHDRGLAGHSDADVLSHAIADALLGAIADGDLGAHFPSSDPRWQGVSSLTILEQVMQRVRAAGFAVASIDSVVVAEAPRLSPHVPAMRRALADALGIEKGRISVKATTTDGLGFTGRGEGIAAQAVALLEPTPSA